jgi:dihydroorotase
VNPARILKLERGTLAVGSWADMTVLDCERAVEVRSSEFLSRSRNTPFEGWKLLGGPAMTIVRGRVAWSS